MGEGGQSLISYDLKSRVGWREGGGVNFANSGCTLYDKREMAIMVTNDRIASHYMVL